MDKKENVVSKEEFEDLVMKTHPKLFLVTYDHKDVVGLYYNDTYLFDVTGYELAQPQLPDRVRRILKLCSTKWARLP